MEQDKRDSKKTARSAKPKDDDVHTVNSHTTKTVDHSVDEKADNKAGKGKGKQGSEVTITTTKSTSVTVASTAQTKVDTKAKTKSKSKTKSKGSEVKTSDVKLAKPSTKTKGSSEPEEEKPKRSTKVKSKSKTDDIESDEPIEIEPKKTRARAGKKADKSNDSDSTDSYEEGVKSVVQTDFPISRLLLEYNPEDEKIKDSEEEILNEDLARLAVKPINPKFKIVWDLYKKQKDAFWTAEEIDFSNDRHDFLKVDKNIQHFIKRILAFFAGADSIVNINIRTKFSKITVKEAEIAYGFQQMMENIHGEVYADMLINIITDPDERDELINAFKTVASIKRMIQWAQRWINSDRRIAFSIVVFCIFEGLMFSGAFAAIYWLKKILGEDKMKGLTQSNNLIAKDEGMHTNFGCVMYDYVVHRLTQEEISELMTEGVAICKDFTKDAIRVDMIGMNVELMHDYIEYVADRLMVYLGYNKIFMTKIPDQFQFMDTIGFLNKDNFFERRATEYQKAYNDRNRADWTFKLLAEY
ncbi:ribonucleoside diphosphate reductase beta subunit [Yasminevirus sp. GU-2018]|uniref:Ribonucleoside-diphosphate reductase small chain n=1 Tax=Yasminevirus sp. GU-2018 TaxID=2420051 RepID=A0A5K0U9G2_9VIRU|nr:ribonucleoside diphosphate reductase beta subunit [Yasminevirus sp. GU-2018]